MIEDFLNQDCTVIIPRDELDMFGKPISPIEIPAKCRVKEKYKIVKNKSAEQVVSQIELWFEHDMEITTDSLIRWGETEYPVISIQPKRNTLGEITYKVVYI